MVLIASWPGGGGLVSVYESWMSLDGLGCVLTGGGDTVGMLFLIKSCN